MLVGAVTNPFLKPLELNLFRLGKNIEAGAKFYPDSRRYLTSRFSSCGSMPFARLG